MVKEKIQFEKQKERDNVKAQRDLVPLQMKNI